MYKGIQVIDGYTKCPRVYRVYKVYRLNKNIQGVLEYKGCSGYMNTGCTRHIYKVYKVITGVLEYTGCMRYRK